MFLISKHHFYSTKTKRCPSSVTVVQSYFVYWPGIESAVVHDGSRSPWRGSNATGVDRGTALPGIQLSGIQPVS